MSGRVTPLYGKRKPKKKAPGKKPNAHRQRQLAARRKRYAASGLARVRAERKEAAAESAE